MQHKVICPSCNKDLTRFAPAAHDINEIHPMECQCGSEFVLAVEYIVTGYTRSYMCDRCSMFVELSGNQIHECR